MNFYKNNIYRKDLGGLHLYNEERFQRDAPTFPFLYLTANTQIVTRGTNLIMKAVSQARSRNRFKETTSKLRRKKLHEQIKSPIH